MIPSPVLPPKADHFINQAMIGPTGQKQVVG